MLHPSGKTLTGRSFAAWLLLYCLAIAFGVSRAQAQGPDGAASPTTDAAEARYQEAMANTNAAPSVTPASPAPTARISLVEMFFKGGVFMWPILALSILVVLFGVERMFALRSGNILPQGLVHGLASLGETPDLFDPKAAYKLCQQFPSTGAKVVRAMLLKSGRALPEIEAAATLAAQREADRLTSNNRWIALFSNTAMLLGLLGTVQGMIMAFFHTATSVGVSTNKAAELADGIYTALVTTFGGLVVAIPGLVIAHYLDERAMALFRRLDELTATLLPHFERFEGKLRAVRHAEGQAERPVDRQADKEKGPIGDKVNERQPVKAPGKAVG